MIFNRFYQPDFDLERLSRAEPDVVERMGVALAVALGVDPRRVPVDFAITLGVHSYEDVLKSVMAGANVTMMAWLAAQWRAAHGVDRAGGGAMAGGS